MTATEHARAVLRAAYPDLDTAQIERMIPVFLAVQAAIDAGLDSDRAVVAACRAVGDLKNRGQQ